MMQMNTAMEYRPGNDQHWGYHVPSYCCPICGREAVMSREFKHVSDYWVKDYSPEPERNDHDDSAWWAWHKRGEWTKSAIPFAFFDRVYCETCGMDTGPYASEEDANNAWSQLVMLNSMGLAANKEER